MITTALVSWLWHIAEPLIDKIPAVEINSEGILTNVLEYLQAGLYFLPVNTFVQIFSLVLALWTLRIVIAILHSLWKALPIL